MGLASLKLTDDLDAPLACDRRPRITEPSAPRAPSLSPAGISRTRAGECGLHPTHPQAPNMSVDAVKITVVGGSLISLGSPVVCANRTGGAGELDASTALAAATGFAGTLPVPVVAVSGGRARRADALGHLVVFDPGVVMLAGPVCSPETSASTKTVDRLSRLCAPLRPPFPLRMW